jgi:hypothetical protein
MPSALSIVWSALSSVWSALSTIGQHSPACRQQFHRNFELEAKVSVDPSLTRTQAAAAASDTGDTIVTLRVTPL